ncbi:MAG: hypothetical protein R3C60_14055 [Parvularculaceae bacterium]
MRKALFVFVTATLPAFAFAQEAPAPQPLVPLAPIEQAPLAKSVFATGVLDKSSGALPDKLWRGADAELLKTLIEKAPARPAAPSINAALRLVLESAGDPPVGSSAELGGAKLMALARAGFADDARTIESLSTGDKGEPTILEALAVADLLRNDPVGACEKNQRIAGALNDVEAVKLRVFCYARANELDAAELALSVLRDRGDLSETDVAILTPLTAGGALQRPVAPIDAIHYAALRAMNISLTPDLLGAADAGVLAAIANNAEASVELRLEAARRAAAMGALDGAALRTLFGSVSIDVATVSNADALLRLQLDDVSTLAAAFQNVASKSAPEFIRDRAVMIADVINRSQGFSRKYAASLLFADDITTLEGAIVNPTEAQAFALARLMVGDAAGAERWLSNAAEGDNLPALAGYLSLLDSAASARIAAALGVAPAKPKFISGVGVTHDAALGDIVAAALGAASTGSEGQSALAAVAASTAAAKGDGVARAIVKSGLANAGLESLARRWAFETAYRSASPSLSASEPAPAASGKAETGEGSVPAPSLKPKKAS